METINIHEAKTHLSRLVEKAAKGEPFIIAKAGKPMVKVVPLEEEKPKRIGFLDYCQYRRDHLPIGSGVTEAACKTVFTQRLKQSGMTWKLEGGQWIVDLRVSYLSGTWAHVYQAYLQAKMLPEMGTQKGLGTKTSKKVA